MEENKNLFLLLALLRSELRALKVDEIPSGKLEGLLEDINQVLRKVIFRSKELHVAVLFEAALHGINRANRFAQQGLYNEAAQIARATLTNVLVNEDLFR